jgi:hypothetical protein
VKDTTFYNHAIDNDDDSTIIEAPYELVTMPDGTFVGFEEIEIVQVGMATHQGWAGTDRDVRIFATALVVRTGQRILKVWQVNCNESDPSPYPERCKKWGVKLSRQAHLRQDAEVALGRPLTRLQRLSPRQLFLGRRFIAPIRPADTPVRYSVAGCFQTASTKRAPNGPIPTEE